MSIGKFKIPEGIKRHGVKMIGLLEKYCEESKDRDFPSHVHLFKLYSMFPEKNNIPLIAKLLIRMLKYLPEKDFSNCLYVLLTDTMKADVMEQAMSLQGLLDMASFEEFWELRKKMDEKLFDEDFDSFARKFIVNVLEITYKRIKKSLICKMLGVKEEEMNEKFCQDLRLQIGEDGLIHLPENRFNQPKDTHYRKVTYENVAGIISDSFTPKKRTT